MPTQFGYIVVLLKLIAVSYSLQTKDVDRQKFSDEHHPYLVRHSRHIYVYNGTARIKLPTHLVVNRTLSRVNHIRFFKKPSKQAQSLSSESPNSGYNKQQGTPHIHISTENPCLNGASLAFTTNGSHCVCKPGFKGTFCQVKDNCFPNPCMNNGVCHDQAGVTRCNCQPGFTDLFCKVPNPCVARPCMHGRCVEAPDHHRYGPFFDSYSCLCDKGYTGKDCQKKICDSCDENAKCVSDETSDRCVCNHGYKGNGLICTFLDSFGPCSGYPCRNNGTCIELDKKTYDCRCIVGYSGGNCEKRLNCIPNPCKNDGVCFETVQSFRCVCPEKYTGKDCSRAVIVQDKCNPNPCRVGGICRTSEDGTRAYCQCPTFKFKAPFCECDCPKANILKQKHSVDAFCNKEGDCICPQTNMYLTPWGCVPAVIMDDPCSSNPCLNKATCYNLNTSALIRNYKSYGCRCPFGFMGLRCEIKMPDPCLRNPCKNSGTCTASAKGIPICSCKSGFVPPYCDTPEPGVNKCFPNPCVNRGECFLVNNTYNCKCRKGFTGTHCQVTIDDCGGCHSPNSYCFLGKCVCKPGFVGNGKYCIPVLKGSKVIGHPIINVVRRKNIAKIDSSKMSRKTKPARTNHDP